MSANSIGHLSTRIIGKVKRLFGIRESNIDYWKRRVSQLGDKAVFNFNHANDELAEVTRHQKEVIYSLLKQSLSGNEKTALDFGCGTGRFTSDLAVLIKGQAIGVDPMEELLKKAPKGENTRYLVSDPSKKIDLPDASIDLLFICLVLGCIKEKELIKLVNDFERLLRTDGTILLVENTSKEADLPHFYFRDTNWYSALFKFADLKEVGCYDDLGQQITIFTGKKK